MKEIIFVTHNKGKAKSAERYFNNIKFKTYDFELDEPRSDDIKEIATAKVNQAFKMLNKPCIALDTGFFIDELNGFPRAFVNFSLDACCFSTVNTGFVSSEADTISCLIVCSLVVSTGCSF